LFFVVFLLFSCCVLCQEKKKKEPKITIEVMSKPSESECYPVAQDGDNIAVHYVGQLENGKVFDSSEEREPMVVQVGAGRTIPGFEEGLKGMCPGEERMITIPPELAYGDKGVPPTIPPRATLIFKLSCISVDRPSIGKDFLPFFQSISPFLVVVLIVAYFYYKFNNTDEPVTVSKKTQKLDSKKKKRQ